LVTKLGMNIMLSILGNVSEVFKEEVSRIARYVSSFALKRGLSLPEEVIISFHEYFRGNDNWLNVFEGVHINMDDYRLMVIEKASMDNVNFQRVLAGLFACILIHNFQSVSNEEILVFVNEHFLKVLSYIYARD